MNSPKKVKTIITKIKPIINSNTFEVTITKNLDLKIYKPFLN